MTTPVFPAVGADGKIRENHLPTWLSEAEIAKDRGGYQGTGFPNGKVSAPVGSIYTDTAATAGAIRWIKATGAGNTGWEVQYGDTGWRDISTLTEGIDFLRISRTVNRVSIVGGGTRVATGGAFLTKVLPTSFLPAEQRITRGYMVINSAMYPVGNASALNRINYESPPYAGSVAVGDEVAFEASWITLRSWPATLPGTPRL